MRKTEIQLEEAVGLIVENIQPVADVETVSLSEAMGRIGARAVYSGTDNPPFARSPLDGYAFFSEDVKNASGKKPVKLQVVGTVFAGEWWNKKLGSNEAVRIMTGAAIPPGADCVVRQEDVILTEGNLEKPAYVEINRAMGAYENYCFQGEDLKKGDLLLEEGRYIGWVEMGILASAGICQVLVYRRPRIALYVTGDELCFPGQRLQPGKIYDSNYWLLSGRMKEMGYPPAIAGLLPDEPEVVAEELKKAVEKVDLVVTTGGVSVGAKDIFHQVLPLLGAKQIFWRVRMKPGTPAMFSLYQDIPMLHLSGNPFAAAVTFELMAVPAIERLTGDERLNRKRIRAVLASDFNKSGGRRFLRGCLKDGLVMLPSAGKHASGMLFSMAGCNCLVEIPPSKVPVTAGHLVDVILL